MARLFVVMGVSGCGKSTMAKALAKATDGFFLDGDSFHPADNIEKMRAAIALTDDDRWPWLEQVGRQMAAQNGTVFCACSALKRSYRAHISKAAGEDVLFIHLQGARALIETRMRARQDHFMPPSLLNSQFDTLEVPGPDELAFNVDIAHCEPQIVAHILEKLAL